MQTGWCRENWWALRAGGSPKLVPCPAAGCPVPTAAQTLPSFCWEPPGMETPPGTWALRAGKFPWVFSVSITYSSTAHAGPAFHPRGDPG